MAQVFTQIKDLISQDMINKATATLGESESKVSSATSILLPALLARLLREGNANKIKEVVEDAGKAKLINDLPSIFEGHGIIDDKNFGERFENALIGLKDSTFMSAISSKSGVKHENADRLSNWVSATIVAYFGKKVVNEKQSLEGLFGELKSEKGTLASKIPSDMYSKLGLATLFDAAKAPVKEVQKEAPKKKGWGWLLWLIIILAALLIIILCWRSCERKKAPAAVAETIEMTTEKATDGAKLATRELTLPNGDKIMVVENGCEERMSEFLKSGKYRDASLDDLKKVWYSFDYIDFEYDSATELTTGSMSQLNNLIALLKHYPDAKIKIGGFADKIGPDYANLEISKERAEYIKNLFAKGGLSADRVSTEGFSNEFATHPSNAPDSERALDRHIAFRFDK